MLIETYVLKDMGSTLDVTLSYQEKIVDHLLDNVVHLGMDAVIVILEEVAHPSQHILRVGREPVLREEVFQQGHHLVEIDRTLLFEIFHDGR